MKKVLCPEREGCRKCCMPLDPEDIMTTDPDDVFLCGKEGMIPVDLAIKWQIGWVLITEGERDASWETMVDRVAEQIKDLEEEYDVKVEYAVPPEPPSPEIGDDGDYESSSFSAWEFLKDVSYSIKIME